MINKILLDTSMTGFENGMPRIYEGGYSPTIHSHVAKEPFQILEINKLEKEKMENEIKVKVRQATKDGYALCRVPGIVDTCYESSTTRRARVQEGGRICPALATENIPNVLELTDIKKYGQFFYSDGENTYLIRIRKLSPRECWRLQDFADQDYEKAEDVNSSTQLYKQAGNSITKNCLVALIGQLIVGKENVYKDI